MSHPAACPFCAVAADAFVWSSGRVIAIRDAYPVSPGHTLILPRRHVPTWFDASADEQAEIWQAVAHVKAALDAELRPDGYNVGFNAGAAAGQTVMHLHVHVIPRFLGDMDDPRGGVRHVIPSQGNYLQRPSSLSTGGEGDPFAAHIVPLFARAGDVAILAAFVQETGLLRIQRDLQAALARGARVRLLTGDYLHITQASALELLLGWQTRDDDDARPVVEARVIEVERLPGRTRSFHPKSWRFEGPDFGIAFVGSSNLSYAALDTAIEWNLRVDRDRDAHAYRRVRDAFEDLWARGRPLDRAYIDAYAQLARESARALPAGEAEAEHLPPPDPPHSVQRDALERLRAARAEGRRRALVVLATGLGKTWLAAFDYQQLWDELGRPPRLLFVAHRVEILRQAALTWRRLVAPRDPGLRVSFCVGDAGDLGGHAVFASVRKLVGLRERLARERFDYVVIDEVHHAAASSYRVLEVVDPLFLLGLTATPDRADSGDIFGLFDDFVAFRASVGEGIAIGRLVPFRYFGVKDAIEYDNIPWRDRRFDPKALAAAAQTEARMETLWSAWQAHPGARTLVFCCSVAHACYVRAWLRDRGLRVAAVFSDTAADEPSDPREASLAALTAGGLDALCAVDVFNEGVDVPMLDRVVMLRPTESGVVFLQQLGRGLRAAEGKEALTVIDFVGNHRVFLERLRTLLSLGGNAATLSGLIGSGHVELPEGCSVDLAIDAKRLLEDLFRVGGADEVERAYRELRLLRGARPTAGELLRMGYQPRSLRARHGSWFDFVGAEGDLTEEEKPVVAALRGFLDEVEATGMTKSFKMVTLEALLDADALLTGMPLRDLALRAWAVLRRAPGLLADVPEAERLPDAPDAAAERRWLAYWRKNPIEAWTSAKSAKRARRTWFRLDEGRFGLDTPVAPEVAAPFGALVRELVDYRMAAYRRRSASVSASSFVCRVLSNQRDPILKLPDRKLQPVPEGEADVRLPDGSVWLFRFAKEFCNVARPAGTDRNRLPDLLRRWFGPQAGAPGTAFEVRFAASPDGWWVEPVQANVVELAPRRGIVAYPDLRAAAGHALQDAEAPDAERVWLPVDVDDPGLFAVRVAGTSMDGGSAPLRDGDWAVMKLARNASAAALQGRVVLVQLPGPVAFRFQIKRIVHRDDAWWLVSDNPDGPTFPADDETVAIARLDRSIRPEDLAPAVGTRLTDAQLADAFAIDGLHAASGSHGGHRFVFVDAKALVAPDRLRWPGVPRPGETLYVLARAGEGWRYLGVGRWREDESLWAIPEVDFETWRAWGEGRDASRPLPAQALARAQEVADAVLGVPDAVLSQGRRRARVLGRAARGGLRIDGGEDGFSERTVSLTDLAWVVVADGDVRDNGGLLDEERVNRLRYLEGTPKGSTRWVDTGWALAAWGLGAALVSSGPRKPVRDDGSVVDATFVVERLDGQVTIVFEAKGGAAGAAGARNTEYGEGLELILGRLGRAGARLTDAAVESRDTRELPLEERRLLLAGLSYPVELADAAEVRRLMGAAQARVGRAPGAKGAGNPTKRIRVWVDGVGSVGGVLAAMNQT